MKYLPSVPALANISRQYRFSFFLVIFSLCALQGCGLVRNAMLPYIKEHQRLETEGEDAQAEILSVTQTGWTLNDQPELELALRIHPVNSEPYLDKTSLICPLIMIPQFQPGNTVPVKIDRAKKTVTVRGSSKIFPGS